MPGRLNNSEPIVMAKLDCVLLLNQLSLDLVAADFSDGHSATQGGPTRTSRALAIIHLAMHDAYAIMNGNFPPTLKSPPPNPATFPANDENNALAMGAAAFATCRALYPDELARIDHAAADYRQIFAPTAQPNTPAEAFGESVAKAWLAERENDGADAPMRYAPSRGPGAHRVDPHHPGQGYLHPAWGKVAPFVIKTVAADAPLSAPPALHTQEYADAYDQVAVLGRHDTPMKDAKFREQAMIGIFWGYDGANKLGTPPRLYNQVVRQIVSDIEEAGTPLSVADNVRLFAGINAAMADAGIAAWHWKYVYNFWRPVLGIREADPGCGPTERGDGNKLRKEPGNPFWCPLGAPSTNSDVRNGIRPATENFTPNFPAYPSGHATFGSACFETAAAFFGKTPEQIKVTFVSDELNGRNADSRGIVRPRIARSFTLREAIEENKISRIYLGVHWSFDATSGETVGKAVAQKAAGIYTRVPAPAPTGSTLAKSSSSSTATPQSKKV